MDVLAFLRRYLSHYCIWLPAYINFSALITGLIYPIVVHMVGGVASFCGAYIIGPRHGKEIDPSSRHQVARTLEYILLSANLAE